MKRGYVIALMMLLTVMLSACANNAGEQYLAAYDRMITADEEMANFDDVESMHEIETIIQKLNLNHEIFVEDMRKIQFPDNARTEAAMVIRAEEQALELYEAILSNPVGAEWTALMGQASQDKEDAHQALRDKLDLPPAD